MKTAFILPMFGHHSAVYKCEIVDYDRRHGNSTTKWRPLKSGAYKFKVVRCFCFAVFLFVDVFGQMIHEPISTISDFNFESL